MSYFIHNKYDKNSNAKVTATDSGYTYNEDASVEVIDFYGNYSQYRDLDTSSMGISVIDELKYYSRTEGSLQGGNSVTNGMSNSTVKTSLFDILMDITSKIGAKDDLDSSSLFGTINSQSKTSLKPINSAISHIKESANLLTASKSTASNTTTLLVQFKAPYTGVMGVKCEGGAHLYNGGYLVGTTSGGAQITTQVYHPSGETVFMIEVVKDTTYYISYKNTGTKNYTISSVILQYFPKSYKITNFFNSIENFPTFQSTFSKTFTSPNDGYMDLYIKASNSSDANYYAGFQIIDSAGKAVFIDANLLNSVQGFSTSRYAFPVEKNQTYTLKCYRMGWSGSNSGTSTSTSYIQQLGIGYFESNEEHVALTDVYDNQMDMLQLLNKIWTKVSSLSNAVT